MISLLFSMIRIMQLTQLSRFTGAWSFSGTRRRLRIIRPNAAIGIGHGKVFTIGPNLAQGDEMNRASKLGEDIARAKETLLTERAYDALKDTN